MPATVSPSYPSTDWNNHMILSSGLKQHDEKGFHEYLCEIYRWKPWGAHDPALLPRGHLGQAMKRLYHTQPDNRDVFHLLEDIRRLRKAKVTPDVWRQQYAEFLEIKSRRAQRIRDINSKRHFWQHKVKDVANPVLGDDMWGSFQQLKFGRVVVDTLPSSIDPIFGALLYPDGGISIDAVNPYNRSVSSPTVMNTVFRDAAEYLHEYHGIGPGRKYYRPLQHHPACSTFAPTSDKGLELWNNIVAELESEDFVAESQRFYYHYGTNTENENTIIERNYTSESIP